MQGRAGESRTGWPIAGTCAFIEQGCVSASSNPEAHFGGGSQHKIINLVYSYRVNSEQLILGLIIRL